MVSLNLIVTDTYEVLQKSIISEYDRKILLRLYQPICGFGAIALYFTLWSELECDQTITPYKREHTSLLQLMNCTLDEFINYRKHLEALALIKTFRHQDGHYAYLLYAPKKPRDFYDYELFDALLKEKLGTVEYERGRTYFTLAHYDIDNCVDISQSFNEVYQVSGKGYKYQEVSNQIGYSSAYPTLGFDFNSFYLSLKDFFIKKSAITKEIESEIALLATTYNHTARDMVGIVYKSLDGKGNIDILRLQKNARLLRESPSFEGEKIEVKPVTTGSVSLDQKIELFNSIRPLEFLKIKNNGVNPLERDARVIRDLCVNTGLSDPVINVVIDYTLQSNNNRLSKPYMETIAGSLLRSGISEAYEAMNYLNSGNTKVKKEYPAKKESVEEKKTPDEISDESIEESLKKLKELKEMRKNNG